MTVKRSGKRLWADRRRPVTRRSGFSVTASGSEHKLASGESWQLDLGDSLLVEFSWPSVQPGEIVGFGGYLYTDGSVQVELESPSPRRVLTGATAPNWSKFGSQWYAGTEPPAAQLLISAIGKSTVSLALLSCGVVEHEYLAAARGALMANMHTFAPESNFVVRPGRVAITPQGSPRRSGPVPIHLKSCNRCGRFLPINVDNERSTLSFSNHCTADHRLPCSHAGFSKLQGVHGAPNLVLTNGFQLECRFCKKFEVNAAHNPQRTSAQMKEDGARRRGFELLLAELYGGSASLLYRRQTGGNELTDEVWQRFGGLCFKCGVNLGTARKMHLDHTRPLALLWPLDGSATALCKDHNAEKRDRPPAQYYSQAELDRLALLTGIPIKELLDPSPNHDAIDKLLSRLDWFFGGFLESAEMKAVRDGKRTADLMVKALNKVLARAGRGVNLQSTHEAWKTDRGP